MPDCAVGPQEQCTVTRLQKHQAVHALKNPPTQPTGSSQKKPPRTSGGMGGGSVLSSALVTSAHSGRRDSAVGRRSSVGWRGWGPERRSRACIHRTADTCGG